MWPDLLNRRLQITRVRAYRRQRGGARAVVALPDEELHVFARGLQSVQALERVVRGGHVALARVKALREWRESRTVKKRDKERETERLRELLNRVRERERPRTNKVGATPNATHETSI